MTHPARLETLADLRVEIDCIDSELHQLLIKRGEIIHRLIEAKQRQGGGSAFRPGREADMMRGLVARHEGLLPLDTVESIWRIIISTFTYVQSPYSVHADISGGDGAMRDCCRFHFGFTVPYVPHKGAASVIEAVAASTGDLGLIRVEADSEAEAAADPWWRRLEEPQAPKIIARLPFVERPDHPAGMPLFVVAQPLAEAAVRDVCLYAVLADGWKGSAPSRLPAIDADIVGAAPDGAKPSLLVAIDGKVTPQQLREALTQAGAIAPQIAEIGGHAARFEASEAQRPQAPVEAAQ
jgi:chorismate mutase